MSKLIVYIFIASLCATYAVASSGDDGVFDGKMIAMGAFLPQQIAMNKTGKFEPEFLRNMETFSPTIARANKAYGLSDIWGAKITIDDLKKQLKKHQHPESSAKILDRIHYCIRFHVPTSSKNEPHTIQWLSAIWNFYHKSQETDQPLLLHELMEHLSPQKGDMLQWNNGFVAQLILVNALWVTRVYGHQNRFLSPRINGAEEKPIDHSIFFTYQYEQEKYM